MNALGVSTEGKDDFALADELSEMSGVKVPQAVETIRTAPVLHDRVVDAPDMPAGSKGYSWNKIILKYTYFMLKKRIY